MTSVRDGSTDLYRFYDVNDQLLYVGISLSAISRATKHRAEKSWWTDVVRMEVERLPTRPEALAAEMAAIRAEKPVHNVIGNASRHIRTYGSSNERKVATSPKGMNPWACMYCGRGCGKTVEDAYIQVDNDDYWWVLCAECDDIPTPRYWIDASRVADVESINQWTRHLMVKGWFDPASWMDLIQTHCNIPESVPSAYAALVAS